MISTKGVHGSVPSSAPHKVQYSQNEKSAAFHRHTVREAELSGSAMAGYVTAGAVAGGLAGYAAKGLFDCSWKTVAALSLVGAYALTARASSVAKPLSPLEHAHKKADDLQRDTKLVQQILAGKSDSVQCSALEALIRKYDMSATALWELRAGGLSSQQVLEENLKRDFTRYGVGVADVEILRKEIKADASVHDIKALENMQKLAKNKDKVRDNYNTVAQLVLAWHQLKSAPSYKDNVKALYDHLMTENLKPIQKKLNSLNEQTRRDIQIIEAET